MSREKNTEPVKKSYIGEKVRVKCDGGLSRMVQVSIGDLLIPVRRAVVTFEMDSLVKVELEVASDKIDISALQSETLVHIIETPSNGDTETL